MKANDQEHSRNLKTLQPLLNLMKSKVKKKKKKGRKKPMIAAKHWLFRTYSFFSSYLFGNCRFEILLWY